MLSFVYLAIYWNNHHHLLLTTERVSALVLWANLHVLPITIGGPVEAARQHRAVAGVACAGQTGLDRVGEVPGRRRQSVSGSR